MNGKIQVCSIPRLRIARTRFSLRVTSPIRLPQFKGAALRGGFGSVFRRIVCAQRLREDCGDCMLRLTCSYSVVFATPNCIESPVFAGNDTMARPFVLDFVDGDKREYAEGDSMELEVTLVGRGIDYFPYFYLVFDELGKSGFGSRGENGRRGTFIIEKITQVSGNGEKALFSRGSDAFVPPRPELVPEFVPEASLPESFSEVLVRFLTPCRMRYNGRLSSQVDFHVLVRNALRRISMLYLLDTGKPLELDFRGLIARAETVRTADADLKWVDYDRYSTRQRTSMKLGGVVGWALYTGQLGEFVPILRIIEHINVGKGTSFGFGRITVGWQFGHLSGSCERGLEFES